MDSSNLQILCELSDKNPLLLDVDHVIYSYDFTLSQIKNHPLMKLYVQADMSKFKSYIDENSADIANTKSMANRALDLVYYVAAKKNNIAILSLLSKFSNCVSSIIMNRIYLRACTQSSLDVLAFLKIINLCKATIDNCCAVLLATSSNSIDCVRKLFDLWPVLKTTENIHKAIWVATNLKNYKMVCFLLDSKTPCSSYLQRAFELACEICRPIAEYLVLNVESIDMTTIIALAENPVFIYIDDNTMKFFKKIIPAHQLHKMMTIQLVVQFREENVDAITLINNQFADIMTASLFDEIFFIIYKKPSASNIVLLMFEIWNNIANAKSNVYFEKLCATGNYELCRVLLDKYSYDVVLSPGRLFVQACSSGNTELVNFLFNVKFKTYTYTSASKIALYQAYHNYDEEMINWICNHIKFENINKLSIWFNRDIKNGNSHRVINLLKRCTNRAIELLYKKMENDQFYTDCLKQIRNQMAKITPPKSRKISSDFDTNKIQSGLRLSQPKIITYRPTAYPTRRSDTVQTYPARRSDTVQTYPTRRSDTVKTYPTRCSDTVKTYRSGVNRY